MIKVHEETTYRKFKIRFDNPPIPVRTMDWCGVHDDYDGAPDSNDNRVFYGATAEEVKAEIDEWYLEQE